MTLKSSARAAFLSVLVLAATSIVGGFAAEWQAQAGRTGAEWLGKKVPAAIERVRKIFPKWSSEEMHGMVVDHIPEILWPNSRSYRRRGGRGGAVSRVRQRGVVKRLARACPAISWATKVGRDRPTTIYHALHAV